MHIRDCVLELIKRGRISLLEMRSLRANLAEWVAVAPALGDDAFVEYVETLGHANKELLTRYRTLVAERGASSTMTFMRDAHNVALGVRGNTRKALFDSAVRRITEASLLPEGKEREVNVIQAMGRLIAYMNPSLHVEE